MSWVPAERHRIVPRRISDLDQERPRIEENVLVDRHPNDVGFAAERIGSKCVAAEGWLLEQNHPVTTAERPSQWHS